MCVVTAVCRPSPGDLVTKLTLATPIQLVARTMAGPNSGLERKDHKWLKMVIPNSFLGESRQCHVCG